MLKPKGPAWWGMDDPIRHTAIAAKWQFRQENAGPAAALGVEYRERKQYSGVRRLTSIFLVGTKKLTENSVSVTGNVGVAYDSWTGGRRTKTYLTPLVGVMICFPQGTTVGVDYKWDQGGGWPGPNCQARFGIVLRQHMIVQFIYTGRGQIVPRRREFIRLHIKQILPGEFCTIGTPDTEYYLDTITGIGSSSGRQPPSGFTPCSLYSFIISF